LVILDHGWEGALIGGQAADLDRFANDWRLPEGSEEAAGHASIASTMRYAHFAKSQVVDAMAVLNSKTGTQPTA
jgi:hypothetical protein